MLLVLSLSTLSGCVYFNTFYNAQRYFKQAEKARQEQEKLDEENPGAFRSRGRGDQASDLYSKASRKASYVLEQFGDSKWVDDAMFILGRSLYWQSDYRTAIETFTDLEENFPESPYYARARYWRALCYEGQGEIGQAQGLYRQILADGKEEIAVLAGQRLGGMAFAVEAYNEAIREYQAVLDAFPRTDARAQLLLDLGESLLALEDETRSDAALKIFDQVLEGDSDLEQEYQARLNRGRIFYLRGDFDAALDIYQNLLDQSRFRPFEGRTRLLVGQYYQERRQTEEALAQYNQVRDDFPKTSQSAMALYYTGVIQLQAYGQVELARDLFADIRGENSGGKAAELGREMLNDLEEVDRITGRIVRADSLAELVAALPDSAAVDSFLTQHRERQRGREESVDILKELFTVADIYRRKLAQPDSAAHYYRQAIERFPQSLQVPRALFAIAWIEVEMRRDLEGARPHLEQLIEAYPESELANAARGYLGQDTVVSREVKAAGEYERIELLRLQDERAIDLYLPMLDSLVQRYPNTPSGAQAAYLAAWAVENFRGDTTGARLRYERIEANFAETQYAELVQQRREATATGALVKLERQVRGWAGSAAAGEQLLAIAVEPDTVDTTLSALKHFRFGLRAYQRGEMDEAQEELELSLEQRLGNSEALYYLGNIMWEQGYRQDAINYYRTALEHNKRYNNAYYRLLAAFAAEEEADSANAYLQQLLIRDRRSSQVQFLLQDRPDLAKDASLGTRELQKLPLQAEEEEGLKPEPLRLQDLPQVRRAVAPVYPGEAAGDSVTVTLDILVDHQGKPATVVVFAGAAPYREAAVAAAEQYEFYPGLDRGGLPVQVWVELNMPVVPKPAAESGMVGAVDRGSGEEEVDQ